jgi:hypothetical protein
MVLPGIATTTIVCRRLGSAKSIIRSVSAAFACVELMNDASKLGLQDLDAVQHNLIRLYLADGLHIEEKSVWPSIVVKGLTLLRRVLITRIFGQWPALSSAFALYGNCQGGQDLPFSFRILLIPKVKMSKFVMGVVFEADGGRWAPFGVLLGDAFLGDASQVDLLALAQLYNQDTVPLRISNHGIAYPLIRTRRVNGKIAGVHLHNLVGGALGVENELDRAVLAILLAVAVTRVEHVVNVLGTKRYQPDAMGDELVGEDGGVLLDLDQVNGHGRDFAKHYASERVRKGQVDIVELKLDALLVGLVID